MKKLSVWVGVLATLLLFSCDQSPYEKFDKPKNQSELDQNAIVEYLATNKIENAQKTESGIYYVIEKEGTGKHPVASDIVEVHYRGTLLNGDEFDSSYKRNQTIAFPLAQVVKGWQEGIPLLKEGGKGKLFIPSGLAYGTTARPGIPANSPLIFDVELQKVLDEQGFKEFQKEQYFTSLKSRVAEAEKELGAKEEKEILAFIKKKGWKAKKNEFGVYYVVEKEGDGTHPDFTQAVEVHYRGTLLNGKEFDSSKKHGKPITFPLTRVIPGWTTGIPMFSKGGKGKLIIPSYLAYGANDRPNIPANSILVFDVDLLDIK